MDTRTFHAYASSNRIDTLIVRLNCYLSTFTRNTGNLLDCDKTVVDFRNFLFKQTLQEHRRSTAQDNLRVVILIVYTSYYRTNSFAFTIEIAWNLFCFRKFRILKNRSEGVADAYIETAFPLTDDELKELLEALAKKFPGVKLHPVVSVEKELIGGVRVHVGDKLLDASIRARLSQMKTALTA